MGNTYSHKDYLGRAVDCRTPKDAWLMLDTCSGGRAIAQDRMKSKEIPITTTYERGVGKKDQSITGGEGGVSIKPHACAGLSGKLTIDRYTSTATKHRETIKVTKEMNITSIKYKEYEQDLCKFIIESIEENEEEQIDQGKRFTCTSRNLKDRLEEYLSAAKKSKDPSSLLSMWKMVANACSLFLDKTKYTHYVSGIKIGAKQQESTDSKEYGNKVAGEAGGNAYQVARLSAKGQYQRMSETNVSITEERGVIDKHSGDVIKEEVIEVTLTPVFELIEHKALHVIMQALLRCYQHQGSKDNQYGPFKISCREIPASEQEIYWQVINNKEICGTTREEEASTFYTKHLCTGELFEITHKTETKQTEMYVLPEPQQPLKLVPATENLQKISFKLHDNKSKAIHPPKRMASWERESPYFIQRPSSNKGIVKYVLPNNECYLCVEKKEHQCDDDEQPKYTVAAAKKRETESGLMLFYFTPVTKPDALPVSVPLPTRIQNDSSEVELAAGPPPPPPPASPSIQQQPECGSATGTDLPNELKDFFELVGEDYIFPIQVNAGED